VVETRWHASEVKHEQVASLGSVPHEPTVPERIAFWTQLHERLARLANRVDAAAQAKILGAVHAKGADGDARRAARPCRALNCPSMAPRFGAQKQNIGVS
jgi:hypothetical protein